jgi:hypothetical protein
MQATREVLRPYRRNYQHEYIQTKMMMGLELGRATFLGVRTFFGLKRNSGMAGNKPERYRVMRGDSSEPSGHLI